jgi:uncharacterized membrane protein
MAGVSSASVFGSVAIATVASGAFESDKGMGMFGAICFMGGFFGFAIILPLLLLPFTEIGGIVIGVFDFILLVSFLNVVYLQSKR